MVFFSFFFLLQSERACFWKMLLASSCLCKYPSKVPLKRNHLSNNPIVPRGPLTGLSQRTKRKIERFICYHIIFFRRVYSNSLIFIASKEWKCFLIKIFFISLNYIRYFLRWTQRVQLFDKNKIVITKY